MEFVSFRSCFSQGKRERSILLGVVKLDSKVLPLLVINRNAPNLLARAVEELEVILLAAHVINQRADLELDLVVAVVGGFVPSIEVLVCQVEGTLGILLDREVQSLDTLVRSVLRRVLGELQSCATEAVLFLEDRRITDGHFDRGVGGAIEAGRLCGGEFENLRPGEVVALNVVWVEERVGCVKGGGGLGQVGGNTAIKNQGALHIIGRCAEGDVRVEGWSRQGKRSC